MLVVKVANASQGVRTQKYNGRRNMRCFVRVRKVMERDSMFATRGGWFFPRLLKKEGDVSQIENHWDAVSKIETELMRKMIALGFDWHDETKMSQLAAECKTFGPAQAQAAYASNDREQVTKAELFALASLMMRTMEEAANEGRDVHGGEVWKALGKHLYR